MKKLVLILAFLIGSMSSAFAACTGPVVMHDFPGTSFNMSVVTAPTGANDCQSNTAIPTWAGGTLGAMANFGSTPGAVLVPGVNAHIISSSVGAPTGTTSTGALGSMVNCASTTSPSGQTTGNQSYVNCAPNGQVRFIPSYGTTDAVADPCLTAAKTTVLFTLATAAVKVAITGVSAKKIYVCAWDLNNNAADGVALFEATTGTTCATAAAALIGNGTSVATAAQGYNFAANGGMARGNGSNQVLATLTNAADLCVAQTAATQLSGSFTYVTQ